MYVKRQCLQPPVARNTAERTVIERPISGDEYRF
jgi:hypothetical protein